MKTTLKIEGMSCGHCVSAVNNALKAVAGVQSVNVSLEGKCAEIEHADSVSLDSLKAAVIGEDFQVV